MEKNLSIQDIREIISEKYSSKNFIQKSFPTVSYKEYEEIKNSNYKTQAQTIGLKIGKDKTGPIIILTISAFFLFTFPYFNPTKETTSFLMIIYCICFGLIILSIYNIFFNHKVILTTNSNSFTFGKQTVFWDKILTTGILTLHGKPSHRVVVLGLSNGDIVKINVESSQISTDDLIRIIHLNIKIP